MAGGIEIKAIYTIVCDHCGVRAEPDVEYRTRVEAMIARTRIAHHDGWLLRHLGPVDDLICPECAAQKSVLPER